MHILDYIARHFGQQPEPEEPVLRRGPELPILKAQVDLHFIVDNIENPEAMRMFVETLNNLLFKVTKTKDYTRIDRRPGFRPVNDTFGSFTVLPPDEGKYNIGEENGK